MGVLDDGSPWQVMDFLSGITLGEELRMHRQLPVGRAVALAVQVLDALGAAHAAGIVHRDIKPENIYLDEEVGRALLSDFGIARTTARLPSVSIFPSPLEHRSNRSSRTSF